MIFEILLCTNEPQYILAESGVRTLQPGQTWAFSGSSGQLICGTVVQQSIGAPNWTASTQYSGCGPCLQAITHFFSANTEDYVCFIGCSGNTVSITPPNPVWVNNYGDQVTQLNAVTLGGPNGLNN